MSDKTFRLIAENPQRFSDNRGSMAILYEEGNVIVKRSHSHANVFRGLHFQDSAAPQLKMVRVISGRVIDIAVDVETNSAQYRTLTPDSDWVVIDSGLAHGFYTLEETLLEYVCHGAYSAEHEHSYNISYFLNSVLEIPEPNISAKDLAGEPLMITTWQNLDD